VALDAAWDLVKDWSLAELVETRALVPKMGLQTPFRGGSLREIAIESLQIARDGLARRNCLDAFNRDETFFLETLERSAQSGLTPADEMVAEFEGRWQGDIDEVYRDYCY
jgi:glutamate--cysteine ligase